MTKRAASGIAFTLCACLFAGCGASASADASDDNPTAPTPSSAPATTTTTVPPPYSFDGSVPPPELINTGTDYETIYRSLDNYARWIEAHRPDPALADEIYVVGTSTHQGYVDDLAVLNQKRWRLVDVGKSVAVSIVDADLRVASLRVQERLASLDARDESGAIVDSQTFAAPLDWLVLLSGDAEGRWRIASVDPAESAG